MSEFWNGTVWPGIQGIYSDIVGILPTLLGALTIFVVGWILAGILRRMVSRLLDKVGFNAVVERAGISGFLQRSGYAKPPSAIIGQLVFWMVILTFLLSAAERLQMQAVVSTLQQFVAFIPNLITVAFLLVFGAVLARFLGGLVQGAASESGMDFGEMLGKLVSNLVIIAVVIIAISQLDIEAGVLNIILSALLGALALAAAITVGFGSRNVSRGMISGVYARKGFEVGQQLKLSNVEGEIVEIGTVSTIVKTKAGKKVSIPNHLMVEEIAEFTSEDG